MVDEIVYHYTDEEGWKNIFASKKIRQSRQTINGNF